MNCRRKAGLRREETWAFLVGVRAVWLIEEVTSHTHDVGRALAEREGFSICDAMILVSALIACGTALRSEDFGNGLLVEDRLRIVTFSLNLGGLDLESPSRVRVLSGGTVIAGVSGAVAVLVVRN